LPALWPEGVAGLSLMPFLAAHFRARRRLLLSMAVGVLVFMLCSAQVTEQLRLALAWDGAAASYLALVFVMAVRSRSERMRRRAEEEDISIVSNLLIAVAAAGFSLFAVTTLLMLSHGLAQPARTLHLLLGGVTTLLSWLVVHTLFAVHYAHGYYAPDAAQAGAVRAGLQFPGEDSPDYFDFLYYAFVIGMTAQVSDVAIKGRNMRRTGLVHGIVSFIFNTVVLAFAVNIAAGLV
jgi:uncharacterized membrane protein